MNILIAPDSFKGSLSAVDFCHIVSEEIKRYRADANLSLMPLADGGEGTIEAILANSSGKLYSVSVRNPLGKPVMAQYAILEKEQTAVIEMAQASGLPLLSSKERNPMIASSYGTGELIKIVLDQGCRKFIIGLGGSASNDGGTGMLQALGVRFLDAQQQEIQACGQELKNIERIDLSDFEPRLKECEIIIAGDVTNPLLGEWGATYTFGRQKGADKQMLAELEEGMKLYAEKTRLLFGTDNTIPGAGAAGGMGFALIAYCQAFMKSGFELIAEMADLDGIFTARDSRPNLIITGEGRFDSQSLHGKLVGRLSERADKYNIPMIVICGSVGEDLDMNVLSRNISGFSICQSPSTLDYAMENAPVLLKKLMSNLVKVGLINRDNTF